MSEIVEELVNGLAGAQSYGKLEIKSEAGQKEEGRWTIPASAVERCLKEREAKNG